MLAYTCLQQVLLLGTKHAAAHRLRRQYLTGTPIRIPLPPRCERQGTFKSVTLQVANSHTVAVFVLNGAARGERQLAGWLAGWLAAGGCQVPAAGCPAAPLACAAPTALEDTAAISLH